MMMQVGAYPTESEATAMLEELQQQGIEAQDPPYSLNR